MGDYSPYSNHKSDNLPRFKVTTRNRSEVMSVKVPKFVANICTNQEAWVVGSAADPLSSSPRDWDVLVPFHTWHLVASFVPSDARPNSFGGWKFEVDGVEIDVWPGDLAFICRQCAFRWAWNPSLGIRIKQERDQ